MHTQVKQVSRGNRPFPHSFGRCCDKHKRGAGEPHRNMPQPAKKGTPGSALKVGTQGKHVEVSRAAGCEPGHTRGGKGAVGGRHGEAGRVQILGSPEMHSGPQAWSPSEFAFSTMQAALPSQTVPTKATGNT